MFVQYFAPLNQYSQPMLQLVVECPAQGCMKKQQAHITAGGAIYSKPFLSFSVIHFRTVLDALAEAAV